MDIELINPFILASFSVLEMVLGNAPTKGTISIQSSGATSQQVNVVCGVTGQVRGQVIYGMSLVTADRVASTMLGQTIKVFDGLAASAIAELGNMISGNASLQLSEGGHISDITPPAVIRGTNIEITTFPLPAIVIPMTIAEGEIFVTVGLKRLEQELPVPAAA